MDANRSYANLCIAALIACSLGMVAAALAFQTHAGFKKSVFDISAFIGPTAQSVLAGRGLEVCSDAMGTEGNPICYRSARMPVATLTIAAGAKLLGDRIQLVNLFKSVLCLVPLWAAMAFVLRQPWQSRRYVTVCAILLLIPVLMPLYFISVSNMGVEEGYLFGPLALAVALLLFPRRGPALAWGGLAAAALAVLYLAKSSMLLAVLVLLAASMSRAPNWGVRAVMFVVVALAPLSWALVQHQASGRYAPGTSLDGINFHKGNNAEFLDRYPPPRNANLDRFDVELNRGQVFEDEWGFNDYHMKAGLGFATAHPGETVKAALRKLDVFFLSLDQYGGGSAYSGALQAIILANMILFRLLLWTALGVCVYAAATNRAIGRGLGLAMLAFFAAFATPYIAGFAYTRHAMVLAFPVMLILCRTRLVVAEAMQRANGRSAAAAA